MQLKFTQKKITAVFSKAFVAICLAFSSLTINAQTISTAGGTNYGGDLSINNTAPLTVSFVLENTTAAAVALTNVSCQMAPFVGISNAGDASVTKLFVSSTSLSGIYDISTAAWTQIGSGNAVVPAAVTYTPVITGINYIIPAGAQLRFVLELSKGLRISGPFAGFPLPTPNSFTSSGIVLKLGDNQIAGQNVGFGGVTPAAPIGNTPVFFGGSVTLVSTVPCAGLPAPGNTVSSVSTVCPGISFNLSLQNTTSGSGVTYQWQSAPSAAGPWTNIAGATASGLTTTQSAATCYRCNVTCASVGGGTTTSTPVCVALTPPSGCYCIPPASDCTDDDVITKVEISTLSNASTCGTGPPAGYTNYTSTVAAPVVFAGAANPVRVEKPTVWSEGVAIWIDYNQNGNFEAAELTSLGTVPAATAALTGNINIPTTALTGVTRMRVRMQFAGVPTGACTAIGFGETEDYNVNIQPCVPVTITSAPSSVSVVCSGNASFTVAATGSLPSYSWQYRSSAAGVWQTVTGVLPFTYTGANTATLSLSAVTQPLNGYQFRALVSGGCSAVDFSAPPATLTVTPLVPVVNPASASICLGSTQQLTLTNTLGNTDLITEGFEGTTLPAGWNMQNLSTPIGTTPTWLFGSALLAPAQNGTPNSYALGNFNNVAGNNTISNWLLTPTVAIKNGDQFKFWTRTVTGPLFPDRLEVRMSTNGASTNVGATNTSVGDFTNLLLTINPSLTTTGYPAVWTQYTITVSGLGAPTTGRMAFRYFVTSGGPAGANSDNIGIDNVVYTSTGGAAQGIWTGPAGTIYSDAGATTLYTGVPATTVFVKPTAAGVNNYQVSYSTLTPCTSATTTVPVTVTAPVGTVTNPVNRTVCVGGSTTYTASATGGPVTYQWQVSVDGGLTFSNISGATSSTLSLTGITQSMNNNRYRAVISAAPCVATVNTTAATLTVNALPIVTLSSSDLLLIPGQFTSVVASSTPAAAAGGWAWTYNGNPIVGNTTNTVSNIGIDEIGTYRATVTDVNGCTNSSANIVIGSEASDRLWIYPNPNDGNFQVRLYYDPSSISERRAVYIYNAQGQLMTSREFDLVNTTAPYLRMDFDLSRAAAGTYVVKVVHKFTGKIVSGLVVVK